MLNIDSWALVNPKIKPHMFWHDATFLEKTMLDLTLDLTSDATLVIHEPQCPVRPAGYPEHLFAATMSEGYSLIESRERRFVFVPQTSADTGTTQSPPGLQIPDIAGQKLSVLLSCTLKVNHAAVEQMKELIPSLSVLASESPDDREVPADQHLSSYFPGYPKELFYDQSPDRSMHAMVDPKELQALINQAVNQTGSRGAAFDRWAFELDALAGDAFRYPNSSYRYFHIIQGSRALPPTPLWHIDNTSIFDVSPGDNLPSGVSVSNFWQGSGTVYCDIHHNQIQQEVIDEAEKNTKRIEHSDAETTEIFALNFSHPVLWDSIRASIGDKFRVNNISIYDYVANHTSPELSRALHDYEAHVYYNTTALSIYIEQQANDKILDYFKTSQLDAVCTLMGGSVYATPPGYMSLHAVGGDYSSAALHRSPVPGYEKTGTRFGVFIVRLPKSAENQADGRYDAPTHQPGLN